MLVLVFDLPLPPVTADEEDSGVTWKAPGVFEMPDDSKSARLLMMAKPDSGGRKRDEDDEAAADDTCAADETPLAVVATASVDDAVSLRTRLVVVLVLGGPFLVGRADAALAVFACPSASELPRPCCSVAATACCCAQPAACFVSSSLS